MPSAILPKIFDISRLFASPRHDYPAYPLAAFRAHQSETSGPDDPRQELGFPAGSTILVSGPPGSGKSTFSLAMVRSLFFPEEPTIPGSRRAAPAKGTDGDTTAGSQVERRHEEWVVVYISPEIDRERLCLHFGQFGWFKDADPFFDCRGDNFVALRVSERELERPFLGADELVNVVFAELKNFHANPRYEMRKVVVVVDSLTSVLKDSPTPGEWRRQTHDFIHRLRELMGRRLALAILLSERMESSPSEVPTEEHVADTVLQLAVKKTGSGHVLRCVNVVKSRGVFLNLGEHTWAIITRDNIGRVIGEPSLILNLGLYLDRQEQTSTFCDKDLVVDTMPFWRKLNTSEKKFDQWFKQRLFASNGGQAEVRSHMRREEARRRILLLTLNLICKSTSLCDLAKPLGFTLKPKTNELHESDVVECNRELLNRLVIADVYPEGLFTPKSLGVWRSCLSEGAKAQCKSSTWATIGIFPRPRLPAIGQKAFPDMTAAKPGSVIETGISGLDEMLLGIEQTAPVGGRDLDASTRCKGLSVGSTSLVVGGSGTGKTGFCMGFCKAGGRWSEGLYVNFENDQERLGEYNLLQQVTGQSIDALNTIYRRRGNLDVNLLLAEIKYVIESKGIQRIAIDGLSDLLSTTTEGEYSRFVETLLEWIRFWGKDVDPRTTDGQGQPSSKRITVMVTFEIDENLHLLPQTHGLSLTADNVIILKQIKLNDQLHRAIYVPKVRGQNHSRQVREVISVPSDEMGLDCRDTKVSIQPGFESYVDVLSKRPEPIEFNLQLFEENSAEASYNRQLAKNLRKNLGFQFNRFRFTNTEITRALCDHLMRKPGVIPPADVRIITVDEWWVRECAVEAQSGVGSAESVTALCTHWINSAEDEPDAASGTPRKGGAVSFPLYSFTNTVSARVSVPETGAEEVDRDLLRQFWHFEVEKGLAIVPKPWPALQDPMDRALPLQAEVLALPYIMDYGMFCLNSACLPLADTPPVEPFHVSSCSETRTSIDGKVRAGLAGVLGGTMWIWALPERVAVGSKSVEWWKSPTKGQSSVLGLAEELKLASSGKLTYSVVFDAETPESGVCFLLEVLWALGGSEDALAHLGRRDGKGPRDQKLLARALRFLAFLVLEGCLPERPRIKDSGQSVFSRHWYSTLVRAHLDRPAEGEKMDGRRPLAIPDLPGFANISSKEEQRERGTRLQRRVQSALILGTRKDKSVTIKGFPPGVVKTAGEVLRAALNSATIRSQLSGPRKALSEITSQKRSELFDPLGIKGETVLELAAAASLDGRDLEILKAADERRQAMANQRALDKSSGAHGVRFVQGMTGFCAAGSWLVGVKAPAHSPKLSWDVLKEMTSLREATRRAEMGAGLPARKDFMEFRGFEPARCAEHLSWRELMVACLSRARRRDRVIPAGVHGLPIYSDLYREMLGILSRAGELKVHYINDRVQVVKEVDSLAVQAVQRISEHIKSIQIQTTERAQRHAQRARNP